MKVKEKFNFLKLQKGVKSLFLKYNFPLYKIEFSKKKMQMD